MFRALLRTCAEICGDKKAAYSFLNLFGGCVLHLCFGVAVKDALLLISPLSFLTLAQAFVDAAASRQMRSVAPPMAVPLPSIQEPFE